MIHITRKKIASLKIVTPPTAKNVKSQLIFQPGTTWGSLKARLPDPDLSVCPFRHFSTVPDGEPVSDEQSFAQTTTIYGVFEGTALVTLDLDIDFSVAAVPVVPGTSIKDVVNSLPVPKKDGFVFQGWSTDGENVVSTNTQISEAITLTPIWVERSTGARIIFNMGSLFEARSDGYVDYSAQWSMIKDGDQFRYPTPLAPQNYFKHWSLTEGGEPIPSNHLFSKEEETIYAVGDVGELINISFNTYGGTPVPTVDPQPAGVLFGYVSRDFKNPTRGTEDDKSDFKGWALTEFSDTTLTATDTLTKSCTLHAQWHHRIDVTIKNNGEDRHVSKEATYWTYGGVLSEIEVLPEGIPAESTFKHWSRYPNGKAINPSTKFSSDIEIYAVYDPYSVITVNANGGTGGTVQIKVPINTPWSEVKAEIEEPTKVENTFRNWSLSIDGEPIPDEYQFAGNVVIYAVWDPFVVISFDAKGGSAVESRKTPIRTIWGDIKGDFTSTQEGYRLSHWSLTDGGEALDDETELTENIKLFAVWVKTWEVTFNANGGENGSEKLIVDDKSTWGTVKEMVQSPTKEGFDLEGWSTDTYPSGTATSILLDGNGGSPDEQSVVVYQNSKWGEVKNFLKKPVKAGYAIKQLNIQEEE